MVQKVNFKLIKLF